MLSPAIMAMPSILAANNRNHQRILQAYENDNKNSRHQNEKEKRKEEEKEEVSPELESLRLEHIRQIRSARDRILAELAERY